MATAAKKPASKTVSSSKPAAKPAAKAKPVTAAKAVAKVTAKVVASKAKKPIAAAKEVPVKPAKPVKPAPAKTTTPVKAKQKPAAAKVAPPPAKPKAVAPEIAKPAARKPAPVVKPQPAPKKPSKQSMKIAETKIPPVKPATTKAAPAKPAAKAGKKIAGIPHNDAELLAMPESDYMNAAQLAYFKTKLTVMRDEILENARETGEHLKENEVFADPNDRATVEEENLLEQRVRDRERKLLKKINTSLARIEAGEYGYCLETGDPIGLPRLLARPTAELSIEAQEKHERLEKLYAD